MNIPHQRLVYFYETVCAGSLRKAAARLNIAPSAVSRQIALLEESLSSSLLDRTRRGIQPTAVGEMLLDYYRDRTALDQQLIAQVEAYQRLETGTITLSVGEGFLASLITAPLKTFAAQYEGIRFNIRMLGTVEVIDTIVSNEAHIGLMYYDMAHPMVRFWHSSQQPLIAVFSPEHPLSSSDEPLSLLELSHFPMAMLEEEYGVRQLVGAAFRRIGSHPHIALTTNAIAVLKNFVRANLGMTLLPHFAVAQEVEDGLLCVRPVSDSLLASAQAHMITRIGRQQPVAVQHLLRKLSRWLNGFGPQP